MSKRVAMIFAVAVLGVLSLVVPRFSRRSGLSIVGTIISRTGGSGRGARWS